MEAAERVASPGPEPEPTSRTDADAKSQGTITAPEPEPEADNGVRNGDHGPKKSSSLSVYAMSMYPKVDPAHRVEYPFDPVVHDDGTIDSARTIYAEDVDYVMENGRQYCGNYCCPVDEQEQTRQYLLHQVLLKFFDLDLTSVTLDSPQCILDVGTGLGEWAIGMAEKYPECEVFGTDIAPIQPTDQVPVNVEFHMEDAEDEWIWPPNAVDLVHLRDMAGAFSDWSYIYQQAFDCLRPRGWIEVVDFDDFFADQNFLAHYPPDSASRTLAAALVEASNLSGRPRGVSHMAHEMLAEIGFVDVEHTVHDLLLGQTADSDKTYANYWLVAIITGIESMCLRPLTKTLGWEPDRVRELCRRASDETKRLAEDMSLGDTFVVKLRVLTARKPFQATPARTMRDWMREKGLLDEEEDGEDYDDYSTIDSRRTLQSEDTR
ncbi:Demethylmenaquinone methyltransferase [Podospora conica]|nr:Demethylmenaquinone methyltransferase [Schizothecium conicum]